MRPGGGGSQSFSTTPFRSPFVYNMYVVLHRRGLQNPRCNTQFPGQPFRNLGRRRTRRNQLQRDRRHRAHFLRRPLGALTRDSSHLASPQAGNTTCSAVQPVLGHRYLRTLKLLRRTGAHAWRELQYRGSACSHTPVDAQSKGYGRSSTVPQEVEASHSDLPTGQDL